MAYFQLRGLPSAIQARAAVVGLPLWPIWREQDLEERRMVLEEVAIWHRTVRDAPRPMESLQLVPFEPVKQTGHETQ